MNFYNEEKKIKVENLDLFKIKKNLNDLQEKIPHYIPYKIQEYAIDLDSEDSINPSIFKKNKYGLYFNSLDDCLYNEIIYFNKKLELFHNEINIIISMINGERLYNNLYYNNFLILNKDLIPFELNIININENIEENPINKINNNNLNIKSFIRIITYRIKLFKSWLKEGYLRYYHLPLFHNIQLFFNDLRIHFCKKYYGENDYSKITPEMICLKFITTKCSTYEELCSSEDRNLDYYNKLYNNEIIWVNGLILQNAKIDPDYCQYLIVNKNNEKTSQKMNIVGITYYIYKYKNEEGDNVNNEKENNEEENEDTNGNENKTESNMSESKNYNETSEENSKTESKIKNSENNGENNTKENKDDIMEEIKKIKVYIYEKRNRCKYHKYYKENSIGYIEFYMNNDKVDQNYIFEHDINIIVDEYGYFDNVEKNK